MRILIAILAITLSLPTSAQKFITSTIVTNDGTTKKQNHEFWYSQKNNTVVSNNLDKITTNRWEYGPIELSKTEYDNHGFFVEHYTPTVEKLFNSKPTDTKYMFRLIYEKEGGTPLIVIVISYKDLKNYSIDKYYTEIYNRKFKQ